MANCHSLFINYNSNLQLDDSKKSKLKKSRIALRDKIKKYFNENKSNEIQPKFRSQGSFVTDTIINPTPVKENDEIKVKYDLDDGVYFLGNEEPEDRKTQATYHNWIVEAVDGHTGTPPIDKDTAVRVEFSEGYHIDLPIYYKNENCVPELAHKSKGWIISDPLAFINWFEDKAHSASQLRRLVRYMKGWRDTRHINNSVKMPSGLILTILTTNCYKSNDRDDIAMKDTLVAIYEELKNNFVCYRPTVPKDEDLFEEFSQTREDYFMEQLERFVLSAKQAIQEPNQKDSCLKWQKHLGDRFPCHKAKDEIEGAKEYPAPAVIKGNAGSA